MLRALVPSLAGVIGVRSASFRGWVGVEASFYPFSNKDPRYSDMLGVFRLADWT